MWFYIMLYNFNFVKTTNVCILSNQIDVISSMVHKNIPSLPRDKMSMALRQALS